MVQTISHSKYQGCCNDFILLRQEEADRIAKEEFSSFIQAVCDRHTGIGADGLIVARTHPFFMEYYNQDGSIAPMCGNGIRCLSCFLRDEGLLQDNPQVRYEEGKTWIPIETLAGLKTVEILQDDPFLVRVNMGQADFHPRAIDTISQIPIWKQEVETEVGTKTIYSFFMSTVHTVLFDEEAMEDIEAKGKALCFHPLFTKQTNVNFVNVLDPNHIQVQTYERGCGVTLACGTGVCASALVCHLEGLCESSIDVELKRGTLHIDIDENQVVYMTGPAQKICRAKYFYISSH